MKKKSKKKVSKKKPVKRKPKVSKVIEEPKEILTAEEILGDKVEPGT